MKENQAWLENKGLLTSGTAPELKTGVKEYVNNIATLVPLVIEDTEASVQNENVQRSCTSYFIFW